MVNPINPGVSPQHLQFQVEETGEPDIKIGVEDQSGDIQIGLEAGKLIPPDKIQTDFPDSNTEDGNTMKCLEQALLNEAGKGHLTGNKREEALTNLKQGVTKISGKLLKEGNRADSSIVADTYEDPTTNKKYYKFLMTWEINVTINGEEKTIRKSQWTITGVEQPTNFSNPKYVRQNHHFALLAVKCHRHILKAGLNPRHKDYTYVRDCIDDVRDSNLLAPNSWGQRLSFTTDLLATEYEGDDRSYKLKQTIGFNQATNALGITLNRPDGKKLNIYIDSTHQGRKIDKTGRKYLKKALDLEKQDQDGYTTLGQKHLRQGQLMAIRGNKEIDNYLDIIQAKPDEVVEKLASMRFEGVNERGRTFLQVKGELLSARKEQAKIHKRNAALEGKKFNATLIQIYAPKLENDKIKTLKFMLMQLFYKEAKVSKSLLKDLQGEKLNYNDSRKLKEAKKDLSRANNNLRDSQAAVKVLKDQIQKEYHQKLTEQLATDPKESYNFQYQELDIENIPASSIVKGNDRLLELAENLLQT